MTKVSHEPAPHQLPPPATLTAAYERGRAAYPEVKLDQRAFRMHVGRICRSQPKLLTRFETACAEDLFLAFGCLDGDPHALRTFAETHVASALAYVERLAISPDAADAVQDLTQRLLGVGDGATKAPKLLLYTGTGALGAFVRVAAVRHARSEARRRARLREDVYEDRVAVTANPERQLIKREVAAGMLDAMRAAVAQLSADERDALRHYYYESMSLEAVAARLGVSRATAARRITNARQHVLAEAKRHVRAGRGAESESMWHLDSSLDLGLSRLLGPG